MKMTLLAFGVKWGFLGASGLTKLLAPSAAVACLAKKAASSSPARATPANPAPASQRNSRRVRPQNSRNMSAIRSEAACGLAGGFTARAKPQAALIQIHKLVQIQRHQTEPPQRLRRRRPV